MTRSIFQRGAEWPTNVQSIQTFDTNIRFNANLPQNGLDWQMFPHHCFPWLSRVDENDLTLRDNREFLMTMPNAQGEERPVRVIPTQTKLATNINNEMSAIVWRCDWATYGLPDLARVMSEGPAGNVVDFIRLEAHSTPPSQADNFTTMRDSFVVKAVNAQAKTITLKGRKYYRKRRTSAVTSLGAPQYPIGNHWGFQRYMRDQLTSDAERQLDDFKAREYDYAFLHWNGGTYRYNRVVDFPTHDLRVADYDSLRTLIDRRNLAGDRLFFRVSFDAGTGATFVDYTDLTSISYDLHHMKAANQDLLDELAALSSANRSDADFMLAKISDIASREIEPSEHVLYFDTYPSGVQAGDTVTMIRRLPHVTTMLATLGMFSQKGGYWDFRLRFDRKKRQFSAPFLWTNYLESFTRSFLQYLKELEIDVIEWPAATTPFMNTHRPEAFRDPSKTMLNYAEINNRDPVMGHPEWTEQGKQQHQILIPFDSPDYVNHSDWHDIRVAIGLPGNPIGLPDHSVAWYVRTSDGKLKFTCGCILSPDAHNNVLDHLQTFLCNPVDGDFVADMEFFAPGQAATDETSPITFDIAHVKAYQFRGFEPGGAGLPNPSGQYPNGLRPTPNDTTGNSGGPTIGVPIPQQNEKQAIVSGYTQAATRNDGGKLLVPDVA